MSPGDARPLGRSSVNVTRLGLGGGALGNLYAEVADDVAAATVSAALDEGVRYFDTAPYYGYGLSERRLGDALRRVARESFAISTKVGRILRPQRSPHARNEGFVGGLPFDPVYDYSYDGVLRSFEDSLHRLGTHRVDVLLLHDIGATTFGATGHPQVFKTAMEGGYRALDELRRGAVIGAIGIGVNEWEVALECFAVADLDCVLLAGRYTLLDQSALEKFLPECERRGVSVIVGGPLNSGILAGEPREGARYDYAPAPPEVLARARKLHAVCARHGTALASAALQFPLHHPAVACVIPGARSPAEMRANGAHLREPIAAALWGELRAEGLLHADAPAGDGRGSA